MRVCPQQTGCGARGKGCGRARSSASITGAALDDALARIRAVPGFERFGFGAELRTVRAAAAEGIPVIYINPAPEGTTLLRLDSAGRIDARPLPITSQDIVFRVLFGIAPDDDISEPISYTLAAAGSPADVESDRDRPDIAEALDGLLPWIGEQIAAPVDDLLAGHRDVGAVLIAFGPLATVPLAAAPFDGDRTLLDRYAISTTPSATAHAAARRRAAAVDNALATLVAIADPTDDLDFARVEITSCPSTSTRPVSVPAPRAQGLGCRSIRRRRRPFTSRATASEG